MGLTNHAPFQWIGLNISPVDKAGYVTLCILCCSWFHFSRNCLDVPQISSSLPEAHGLKFNIACWSSELVPAEKLRSHRNVCHDSRHATTVPLSHSVADELALIEFSSFSSSFPSKDSYLTWTKVNVICAVFLFNHRQFTTVWFTSQGP